MIIIELFCRYYIWLLEVTTTMEEFVNSFLLTVIVEEYYPNIHFSHSTNLSAQDPHPCLRPSPCEDLELTCLNLYPWPNALELPFSTNGSSYESLNFYSESTRLSVLKTLWHLVILSQQHPL